MLNDTSFKYDFERGLIDEIEKLGKIIDVRAGEIIFDVGSLVRFVPIVISGTVKVTRPDDDGRELLLYYLTPGDSCAMTFTCCMRQFPSEIKAVAEDDSKLLMLPTSATDDWIVKYPTWKSFALRTIRDRFIEMLKTIDQIAFQNLDERLVSYLKDKSIATGSIVLNISHEQIAGDLATSRVVISRLLKKLENDGKILLYRNQIRILSDL